MKKIVLILFFIAIPILSQENTINYYEYWFDNNFSEKVAVDVGNPETIINVQTSISIESLSPGLHHLTLRYGDSWGNWSVPQSSSFFKLEQAELNSMVYYEYWFNQDYENKVSGEVTPIDTINVITNISLENIPNGLNSFSIRFRDSRGNWSVTQSSSFFKLEQSIQNEITEYRYWFNENFDEISIVKLTTPIEHLDLIREIIIPEINVDSLHSIHLQYKDANGKWSSVVADSFRYTGGTLSLMPPEQLLPSNGASGISLNPLMQWQKLIYADSYILQIATDTNFANVIQNFNITDTSFTLQESLVLDSIYFWRIRTKSGIFISAWSGTWSFSTGEQQLLSTPLLSEPENNSVNLSINQNFVWQTVENATSYTLQVSINESFTDFVLNQSGIEETQFQLFDLEYNTTYFWRVNATNGTLTSDWSEVWSFVTEEQFDTVSIGNQLWMKKNLDVAYYRNGDTIFHAISNADWQYAASNGIGAWSYYGNEAENGAIYGRLYNWFAVNDPRGLAPNGWRIATDNDWMELEVELGMSQSQAETFGWRGNPVGAKLAGTYDLWTNGVLRNHNLFNSSGFNGIPGGDRLSNGNFRDLGSYCYWWTSSENTSNNAVLRALGFINLDAFKGSENKAMGRYVRCVIDDMLPVVQLISPINEATEQPIILNLEWQAIENATSYTLQVSLTESFNDFVLNQSGIEETQFQFFNLEYNTTYFWRVNATDGTQTSQWSEVWSFSTEENDNLTGKTLWAWGRNNNGQIGDGTNTTRISPTQITMDEDWAIISAGYLHTLAIKNNGTLWAWGLNSSGRLGDGTTTQRQSPVQIGTDTNWIFVSAGGVHTLGIKSDSTLWAWGANSNGRLGDGTYIDRYSPVQIGTDINWKSVSAGGTHSLGIKSDGTLWAWGWNNFGQLGDGTTIDKLAPVQIGTDNNWSSVTTGTNYTIASKNDGTLWAWGYNNEGQLGDGTTTNRLFPVQIGISNDWTLISSGEVHTFALKTDNTLWAWGRNDYGMLGDGTTLNRTSPVQIGTSNDWAFVLAGGTHSLAIKNDGTLWAWGRNNYGQLGDGTTIDKLSPLQIGIESDWVKISVGSYHSIAIKDSDIPSLAAPVLLYPENEATAQSINQNFVWQAVENATSYTLQVSTNESFSDFVINQSGIEETQFQFFDLEYNTTYFWRVNATNGTQTSDWSEVWSFSTEEQIFIQIPLLIAPSNNATTAPININLLWGTVTNANTYNLQVSVDSNFNEIMINQVGIINTNFLASNLNYNSIYYWRVQACVGSQTSAWSLVRNFKTIYLNLIANPSCELPLINNNIQFWNEIIGNNWTIRSNDPVPFDGLNYFYAGASSFAELGQYVDVSLYANEIDNQNINLLFSGRTRSWNQNPPDEAKVILEFWNFEKTEKLDTIDLGYHSTFYWLLVSQIFTPPANTRWVNIRLISLRHNGSNNDGYFDDLFLGKDSSLVSPELVLPLNNSSNLPINPNLVWQAVENATSYTLQVSTNESFNDFVINQSGIDTTEFQVNDLQYDTTYFWRVNATNVTLTSDWSEVWSFSTIPQNISGLSINLQSGWNLISSNILPLETDMDSIFDNNLNLIHVKNNFGNVYSPAYGLNQIGNWDITQGYYVYVTNPSVLQIDGVLVNPLETSISLSQGWNIVSYLRNSEMAAPDALQSISDSIIFAKDGMGNIYHPGYGINNIGNMQPGKGYWIYLPTSAVLTYPAN